MRRSELQRKTPLRRGTPLRAGVPKSRPRAISLASAAQKAKVQRIGLCIVTGATEDLDPAHLWPRGMGGCDHEDCIVPLRRDVHRLLDERELDILPDLIAHECWAELAHMVSAHHVDPIHMVEQLTGERWQPVGAAA